MGTGSDAASEQRAIADICRRIEKALSESPLTAVQMRELATIPGANVSRSDFDSAVGWLLERERIRFSARFGTFCLVPSETLELAHFTVSSKHAARQGNGGTCERCHMRSDVLWRYAESSLGRAVVVCSECKPTLLTESFGPKDAMDTPICTTTGFEGNPRTH